MIEFLSSWAKGIGLSIVIISILEMLLPDNKTKKYIRTIMGIFIIFNVISPVIKNKNFFKIENLDIENYGTSFASSKIDQTSMNERIKELYVEELEKNIKEKIEKEGYKISKCKVFVNVKDDDISSAEIIKIKINIDKKIETNINADKKNGNFLENKVITEIEKIKKEDVKKIKNFLIKEYEVNEKCLEIN